MILPPLLLALQVALVPGDSIGVGRMFTLHSAILAADRTIAVSEPRDCAAPHPCPVLIVLDGEQPFLEAVAATRLLEEAIEAPPMIVVGLWNTGGNRSRDFTPPLPAGQRPPGLAVWGGLEPFERFLTDELLPAVDGRWHAAPLRVLSGHSLGGLVAIDVVVREPAAIRFGLALDPSLWWGNRDWSRRVPGRLRGVRGPRRLITGEVAEGWRDVWPALVAAAGTRRDVRVARFTEPGESHGSMRYKGVYDGLRALFTDYVPGARRGAPATLEAATRQYSALGREYGYTMPVPSAVLRDLARRALGAGDLTRARTIIDLLERDWGPHWETAQLRARADSLAVPGP